MVLRRHPVVASPSLPEPRRVFKGFYKIFKRCGISHAADKGIPDWSRDDSIALGVVPSFGSPAVWGIERQRKLTLN